MTAFCIAHGSSRRRVQGHDRIRSAARHRGVAAVELALLLLPLVLLALGGAELGRAIHTFNTLDKAVRDAARHLSQHGPGDAVIAQQARCLAAHGSLDCSGAALAPGLQASAVVICDAVVCADTHAAQATGQGAVNLVSATLRGYSWTSAVSLVLPELTFRDIGVTMRAQL